jgi:hypothetical protein
MSGDPRRCGGCVAGYALNGNGQCLATASPTAAPSTLAPSDAPTTAAPTQPPSAQPSAAPTATPTFECPAFLNCAEGGCECSPCSARHDVCAYCAGIDTNVCGVCAAGYALGDGGVCVATLSPTAVPTATPSRPPSAAPTTALPSAAPTCGRRARPRSSADARLAGLRRPACRVTPRRKVRSGHPGRRGSDSRGCAAPTSAPSLAPTTAAPTDGMR